MEVPAKLALMSPDELESHVRAHWSEWEGKWRRINANRVSGEMLKVAAGQPIYLIERGGRHYLVTEGTSVDFLNAA
jgi:hypothetical protein